MNVYPGIVQHYQGSKLQCDNVQKERELVFVTESGTLRYKDTDGAYFYIGASGAVGATGPQGASGVVDYSYIDTASGALNTYITNTSGQLDSRITSNDNDISTLTTNLSNTSGQLSTRIDNTLQLDQTTPQTVINGAPLFNVGLKSPKIYPETNTANAIEFNRADGITNLVTLNTLNRQVIINANSPVLKIVAASTAGTSSLQLFENTTILGSWISRGSTYANPDRQKSIEFISYFGDISFWANSTQYLTIKTTGNVGIGVIDPDEKLEVNGNIRHSSDSQYNYFGAAEDAGITYDGTDLVINPRLVGTGNVNISGNIVVSDGATVDGVDVSQLQTDLTNTSGQLDTKITNNTTYIDNVSGQLDNRIDGLEAYNPGLGTTNYIPIYISNSGFGDSCFYTAGGDNCTVYLSGEAPSFRLMSYSGGVDSIYSRPSGTQAHYLFQSNQSNRWKLGIDTNDDFRLERRADNGSSLGNIIYFKRLTGNVGIGTTSPNATLDVSGDIIGQYRSADGTAGFTGTGAYTNFTIKNGLIVAAS